MLSFSQRFNLSKYGRVGRVLFWTFTAFGFIAAAIFLTLRYWILPDIEKYHNEVTRSASNAVGLPVSIGKIEAGWHGFRPYLKLTDVKLLDEHGNSALVLRQVENIVSWSTLLRGELRLNTLAVDGPDLQIRRDKQGVMHVAGLPLSAPSSDGKLSDWLLHQSHIIIRNGRITWQDELYDRPALVLNQAQFRLDNRGRHHLFALRFAPPTDISTPLDVRGDLVGESFSRMDGWRGELFAQINYTDVSTWRPWLALPVEFSRASGGVRAWLGVEGGRVNRVTADMDLGTVQSRLREDLPMLDMTVLHGRAGVSIQDHGFEISTKQLVLQMSNGFKLQPTDFHLRLAGSKQNRFAVGEIQAGSLELGDLAAMAEYVPLGKEFKQKLTTFAPHGRLSDLRVQWNSDEDKRSRFEINARFNGLSLHRADNFPGIENLSGQVSGNDSNGSLSLNAPGLKLDAPNFLLEPVAFDAFTAQLGWQRKPDGWDMKLNNLSVSNDDLSATAYGNYQIGAQALGIADATLSLTRVSLKHIVRYLPKELMGKSTMDWLQSALQGGIADEMHVRLRGDLNEFPFPENKKGLFLVEAKARNVEVDYTKDWPRAEDVTATLLIEGKRLQLDSTSLSMAGARAQKASVVIPDLMSAETLVQIQGEASGETRQALDFIKHSPVRAMMNGFTDKATARGLGKLEVQLEIPLSDKPIKLNGVYHFMDDEISIDETLPLARMVKGDFKFTESVLQVQDMQAQTLGGPARMTVQTDPDGALKIKMQGKANMDVWRRLNPEPALQRLTGAADWNADVTVKGKQFTVLASSNLQGIGSSLPAPLSKRGSEIIPLKFELRSASPSEDVMWLQYGDLANARMVRMDDKIGMRRFKRGYINFGPARHIQDRDGVWVSGSLPLLSVEGWGGVFHSNPNEPSPWPEIDGADVLIQKLVGYGSNVNGLNFHARNRNGTITTQLAAKDLNGEFVWFPQDKGKLVVRLKNATLGSTAKDKKAEASHAVTPEKITRDISIPVIDVAVENFTYRGNPLGRLEFHASQFDKDILLNNLRLSNSDGVLQANGKWGVPSAQTHLVVKLELGDVGNVLGRSGYPNSIKYGKGTLGCDLVWAGAPNDFALANMDGHVDMKMEKGRFLKLDPGAGKLLSVMSLQSLPKRITLDFNDVFSQGFEFDDMSGVAQIRQGILTTSDFKIKGSSAAVTLSGQVDLNRETQNLRVKVLPTIGDSVSLLAFAAGPAVGAGVFLANKLFRDPLDKLVSFEYNVTGSWIDPKVEKVGQAQTPSQ